MLRCGDELVNFDLGAVCEQYVLVRIYTIEIVAPL